MADAILNVSTSAEVEFTVGEKTAAWLVALGWTPPDEDAVVTVPTEGAGSDLVNNTRAPYASLPEAMAAMNGHEAAKYQAQQDYVAMLGELSSPERLTNLLKFFGVKLDRFVPDAQTES